MSSTMAGANATGHTHGAEDQSEASWCHEEATTDATTGKSQGQSTTIADAGTNATGHAHGTEANPDPQNRRGD